MHPTKEMNLDAFFYGGVNHLQEDLWDPGHDECVVDFFSKPLEYKRRYSYGFGGYLERGYEHSGDPTLPDMQESYTITPGRNEPLPPEFDFLYESLFKRLCVLGEEVVRQITNHEAVKEMITGRTYMEQYLSEHINVDMAY